MTGRYEFPQMDRARNGLDPLLCELRRGSCHPAPVDVRQGVQSTLTPFAVLDPTGRVVAVNTTWRTFAAMYPQSVLLAPEVGTNYLDACQEAAARGDETAREALLGIGSVLAGAQPLFTLEYHVPDAHTPGATCFLLEASPLHGPVGGIMISHQDITQRRAFEQTVAHLALRYRTVSEQGSDYAYEILVQPNRGPFVDWVTEAFTRATGYTLGELSRPALLRRIFHRDDRALVRQHFARLCTGQADMAEFRIVTRAGEVRWLRNHARPVWDGWTQQIVAIEGAAQDITEQKRAQEALEQSRIRLQALFDHALDAMLLTDDTGRIVDANPAACQLTGYDARTLTGRSLWSLLSPDHAEQARTAWSSLLETGRQDGEYVILHRDGHHIEAEYRAVARILPGLHLSVLRDVTERKRAVEALRLSEERWRILVNNHPEPILVTVRGQIVFVNRAGEELAGCAKISPLLGRSLSDLFSAEYMDQLEYRIKAFERGETLPPAEYALIHLDGEERYVEVRSVPVTYNGCRAVQTVFRDITERKEFERSLIQAKEEAERAARLRGTILSNINHEIRTPLTTVLGFAEVLATELSGPQRELALFINEGGKRLSNTLNAVLDLARLEADALPVYPEHIDLVARARESLEECRLLLENKPVTLHLEASEEPLRACADGNIVGRILGHLLSNAAKFTDRGTITLRLTAGDDHVRFDVEDTGIGIGADFMPRLFDEFEQESTGLARDYEGSGLGLSITKRLVEIVGGAISVTSEKGRGSTFSVRLPRYMTATTPSATRISSDLIEEVD